MCCLARSSSERGEEDRMMYGVELEELVAEEDDDRHAPSRRSGRSFFLNMLII